MKRKIIKIDEEKCTGCGLCIPNCPEGAIQMIDGKARLVSDLFCDGLGACIGECPEGAIIVEEREAEPYNEKKVMANVARQGANVIKAHLEHLRVHGQDEYLRQARAFLEEKGIVNPLAEREQAAPCAAIGHPAGCPGTLSREFSRETMQETDRDAARPSRLTHWPVQLHLASPLAPQYKGRDVLLAADCTAFALGDFHRDHLAGKALAIACPKLDSDQGVYLEKLRSLIDDAKINTLTVMIMEVPCCRGLLNLAREAIKSASRKIPLKCIVVSLDGKVKSEEWVN